MSMNSGGLMTWPPGGADAIATVNSNCRTAEWSRSETLVAVADETQRHLD